MGKEDKMKTVPTIRMVIDVYRRIAAVERVRTGRPGEKTVRNAATNIRRVCQLGGVSLEEPITALTRKTLTRALDAACASGLKAVTICSYMTSLQSAFARWTRPYYADLKWQAPAIELPSCSRRSPRYARPDAAVLAKVKEWYASLERRPDAREWAAATLMLEFAMRNGDVGSLRWSDFRERDGSACLCYTPHKTALSSGRRVAWPVHPDIWARLRAYRDAGAPKFRRSGWGKNAARDAALVVPCARDVFERLNADLRARKIFTGAKACYELRKICIDHVYQKFGAEMASSISGDDIRTMMRYYADPSQPNIGDVRILDLL